MAFFAPKTWRATLTAYSAAISATKTAAATARFHHTCSIRSFHSSRTLCALNPLLRPTSTRPAQGQNPLAKDASETDPIFEYSEQHSTPLPPKFSQLHASSIANYPGTADKTVSALQGQLLQLLMRMTRPRLVLELGCFMGYSAMAMADGMPSGATLYTCEKDAKAAALARDVFAQQGYSKSGSTVQQAVKIELLEGDAMSSLQDLARKKIQFDAVFLDADKGNYINYLNFILDNDLLASHGYILADNVLYRGLVLQSNENRSSNALPSPPPSPTLQPQSSKDAQSLESPKERRSRASQQKTANHMDAFNKHVKNDPRLEVVVLPVFDGLSMVMRKNGDQPLARALNKV